MKKTNEILLPCPYCGSVEIDIHSVSVDKQYFKSKYEKRMVCRNCDSVGPMPCTIAWNTRVPAKLSEEKVREVVDTYGQSNYTAEITCAIITAYEKGELFQEDK